MMAPTTIGHVDPTHPVTDTPLVKVANDSVTRGQPKGAPTREHDPVYLLNGGHGIEKIGLDRAGCPAAHVYARDRSVSRENHRAAGGPLAQRAMSDRDAFHGGEASRAALGVCVGGRQHRAE